MNCLFRLAFILFLFGTSCESKPKSLDDSAKSLRKGPEIEKPVGESLLMQKPQEKCIFPDSPLVSSPYFKIEVEVYSGPLFSFMLYSNGDLGLIYFNGKRPSVEEMFRAKGDEKKWAQLRFEKQFQKVHLDSSEFNNIKALVLENIDLFKRSFSGADGGTGFAIDVWNSESAAISCLWQDPLPKRHAVFIIKFCDLVFRKFDGERIPILHQGVFEATPSLKRARENGVGEIRRK